jgi:hypothetical protein
MLRAPYIHEFPSYKLGGILYHLLKGGREIMPFVGVRTLPLLRIRHKNPSIYTYHELQSFGS